MAPKRTSRSTPSKGTLKPPAPRTTGSRKSIRAHGASSEPRQLRSNSAEPQMQIGELKDPEQIIRQNKRKNKQSSRASSRASTQEPDELVVDRGAERSLEPSLEPVSEAVDEPSKSPAVTAGDVQGTERTTPSEISREESPEHEEQAPISLFRHSSVEFSVESDSVARTIEESVENTPFGYNQHSLSLIVEEPTEESILAQYAQPPRSLPTSTIYYTQYAQETYENGTFAETAREPSFSSDAASPQPRAPPSRASVRQETIDLTSNDEDEEPVQTPIVARLEPIELISDSEDEDEVRLAPQAHDETVLESVIEDNYRLPAQAHDEIQLDTTIEDRDYSLASQADEESHPESAIELSSGSDEDDGQGDYDMNHDAKDDCSEAANEDEYEGQYEDQYEDHYHGELQKSRGRDPILEEDTILTQAHKYHDEHEREYEQHQHQPTEHDTQVSTPKENKSSKVDFPNPFTNNCAIIRAKRVSSRPTSNESLPISKLGSQPMIINHRIDSSDDTSSDPEDITSLTKEDITTMDTSEAPPSPKVCHTPAGRPPSFLARVQAGVTAVIKSPMKIFSGSPATQAPTLAIQNRAPINKLDLTPFLKPNKSIRQQRYPRTPTKYSQSCGSEHRNTSRSVKFDAATACDSSEESEQPVTVRTPATVRLPVWSIYLHRRTRSAFYTKWTALQNQQKARLINGAQETHGEREYREHLEALKVLVNQAEAHLEDRRAKISAGIATPSATSSKKRNAETRTSMEGSPMKKQRFAFEQTRITTPPGFGQPIPGEDGYRASTQPTWISGSLTPSRENETLSSSQVFGAASANPQALEPLHPCSPGRTFEVPSGDEDDMANPQHASASKDDSIVSQAIGKTFALNYDEFSESEDESMNDFDAWKGKPFSEWTKSTMTAFKGAPLPTGTVPAEQSLLNAVTSILAGHCPDPIHALFKSSDHPRITELGMTPDDFLTVSYPDDRGAVTYTRQSYYHWEVKPPGTEHMTNKERATWKCMEEFKNWRKFSDVVRFYNEDDTPSLVAQIDGRLQEVQRKRKRVEDQEQEILRKEQELERRKVRMVSNQKELDRIRDEQLQKQKEDVAMPKVPAAKQGFLNSMINELEEQAQHAVPSVQQAAARVTVPSNPVRPAGQAPVSSVISPQHPPPFIYDASGNVMLTTQSSAAPSTTASASAWTQSPPPAPTPAHAQLPPQAKTAPVPAPAAQPSNKYAPKKPSRLRESTTYSPGPNVKQSIEKNEDWRLVIPEPQQTGSLFGPGRLTTPPDEKGYSQASVDAGVKAMEELLPIMRRQPGWYGGSQNLPPV